jgi:hypothetical protein
MPEENSVLVVENWYGGGATTLRRTHNHLVNCMYHRYSCWYVRSLFFFFFCILPRRTPFFIFILFPGGHDIVLLKEHADGGEAVFDAR